jgi:CDP-diacylglycerol---glycerol-3-phosphate 3-phosphatidyltransferase
MDGRVQRPQAITPASWITIGRLTLIPLILFHLLSGQENGDLTAFILFLIAALSDTLDGWVARRFNQVSALGKFLDPLADKMLVASTLLVLVSRGLAPVPAVVVIILRELLVTAWRWRALRRGASFSASVAAKVKTDSQLAGIALLMIFPYLPHPEPARLLGVCAIHLGALMALYSALDYLPGRRTLSKQP